MGDVLTLEQQQVFSSALSGPTKFSGTFQHQLCEMWQPHIETALKQQRKMLTLMSLLNQSGMSAPLPLVTTFMTLNGSFGSVEFTQLLGAGLGSMVGLILQCIWPVRIGILKTHNNQRKLSTQFKQ